MTSRRATAYICIVSAAGAASLGYSLWHWHSQDWTRYLFYCAISLIASRMKVSLPGVTGTMSMSFLFVLLGVAELSLGETVAMGCLSMLAQCVLHTRQRPQPVQVLFNVASMAYSILASYRVYHLHWLRAGTLEEPAMILLAAGVFFLTNTLSIAAIIALTEHKNALTVWQGSYFWSFPNYLVGAAVAWMISAVSHLVGWQASLLLLPILYVVFRSHSLYVNRLEEEKKSADQHRQHAEELVALHRRTITALALAVEAKDQTTHDHLERVEVYAVEVGKELGLSEPELEALRASAMLHDIGKLAVPEYIISKPGRLTPEEFEKMKIHPIVGAEIVEQVRFPYAVAPIVRSHHEKWDGSGYPDGLSREQIPIGARILSAVDCLDALASDRQYRRALPLEEAIKIVESEAGKAFDPRVVEVLVRRCVELEKMARSGAQPEKTKLSTDKKVERGAAPAAGFEIKRESPDAGGDLLSFHRALSTGARPSEQVFELTEALKDCRDRQAAFTLARDRTRELVPYHVLVIYEKHGETLTAEYLDGEDYRLFASLEIPLGMGLSGWVAENGMSITNGNPSVEPGYLNDPTKFSSLRSALAVPLEANSGVLGVLALYHQDRDAFTAQNLELLLAFSTKLAAVLENTQAVAPNRERG